MGALRPHNVPSRCSFGPFVTRNPSSSPYSPGAKWLFGARKRRGLGRGEGLIPPRAPWACRHQRFVCCRQRSGNEDGEGKGGKASAPRGIGRPIRWRPTVHGTAQKSARFVVVVGRACARLRASVGPVAGPYPTPSPALGSHPGRGRAACSVPVRLQCLSSHGCLPSGCPSPTCPHPRVWRVHPCPLPGAHPVGNIQS